MSKMKFYLQPSKDYHAITDEEAENIHDVFDYLKCSEKIFVPNDFWGQEDCNGITATDFLLCEGQSDISDYLMQTITKTRSCEKTYEEIMTSSYKGYVVISLKDVDENIKEIYVYNVTDQMDKKRIIVNDIIKTKRYYLALSATYAEYEILAKECFTELIFHEDAFQNINKIGKIGDVCNELTRHLIVLNDVAGLAYTYYNGNEKDIFSELDAGYQVICSGKGANESKEFKMGIKWEGKEYILTCNPHTKLFKKNTDQRIYFCWGRNEIENHKIIIVRIGNHWE